MWKNWHSNNFEKQKVEKLMSQIRYILAAIDVQNCETIIPYLDTMLYRVSKGLGSNCRELRLCIYCSYIVVFIVVYISNIAWHVYSDVVEVFHRTRNSLLYQMYHQSNTVET